jgi:hypothetical protein
VNTVLIVVTLVEVLLLVVVLAGYLIAIAATLRRTSKTLGLVTFGVRAIESQTAPIGPALGDVNAALEQVAAALEDVAGQPDEDSAARGAVAASADRPDGTPDEGPAPVKP